jgi:hypothetical protein
MARRYEGRGPVFAEASGALRKFVAAPRDADLGADAVRSLRKVVAEAPEGTLERWSALQTLAAALLLLGDFERAHTVRLQAARTGLMVVLRDPAVERSEGFEPGRKTVERLIQEPADPQAAAGAVKAFGKLRERTAPETRGHDMALLGLTSACYLGGNFEEAAKWAERLKRGLLPRVLEARRRPGGEGQGPVGPRWKPRRPRPPRLRGSREGERR